MNKTDVIKHFGSKSAVARALGITPQAVYDWPEKIPIGRAFQIQVLTNGKLKVQQSTQAA
jgi:DNA-binding transcriptional regulator YdaS (Cro superfamily)